MGAPLRGNPTTLRFDGVSVEYRIVRTLPGGLPACHVIFEIPCTYHLDLLVLWPASGSSGVAGRVHRAHHVMLSCAPPATGPHCSNPQACLIRQGLCSAAGPVEAAASSAGFAVLRTQPWVLTPCLEADNAREAGHPARWAESDAAESQRSPPAQTSYYCNGCLIYHEDDTGNRTFKPDRQLCSGLERRSWIMYCLHRPQQAVRAGPTRLCAHAHSGLQGLASCRPCPVLQRRSCQTVVLHGF